MELVKVDFSGGGDGVTALYVDGKLNTYGDYYHNKIDEFIKGIEHGIMLTGGEYTLTYWGIDQGLKSDHELVIEISENADCPPDTLQEVLDTLK